MGTCSYHFLPTRWWGQGSRGAPARGAEGSHGLSWCLHPQAGWGEHKLGEQQGLPAPPGAGFQRPPSGPLATGGTCSPVFFSTEREAVDSPHRLQHHVPRSAQLATAAAPCVRDPPTNLPCAPRVSCACPERLWAVAEGGSTSTRAWPSEGPRRSVDQACASGEGGHGRAADGWQTESTLRHTQAHSGTQHTHTQALCVHLHETCTQH